MGVAVMGLEGDALNWIQWENKRRTIMNCRMLRRMMLKRFIGWKGGSIIEQWLSVQQDGGMEDYEKVFIQFASNIDEEVSESFCLSNFMKGLKMKIKAELRLMDLVNIEEALEWAVKIEEKLIAMGTAGVRGG